MKFSLDVEEVATTLVSTASLGNLRKNIAAVTEELNDVERQAMDYILEK
jgi:aryl-alcohol dehydrogenase-like predicted oxidoreductase